jgi:hypothetical protein
MSAISDAFVTPAIAEGELRTLLDAQGAELRDLRQRVSALEKQRQPRPIAGGAVLIAIIANATAGYAFGAGELLAHGRTDSDLRQALCTARIRTPRRLGQPLRRLAIDPPEGNLQIVRLPRDADGAKWIVATV